MTFQQFIAGPDDSGRRLDRVVRTVAADARLSDIYAAIRKGFIKVKGKKVAQDIRLQEGNSIEIAEFIFENDGLQTLQKTSEKQTCPPIEVLFESAAIRALNKPSGVPVQGTKIQEGIADYCRREFAAGQAEKSSLAFVPAPLHRLDKETSGILVCSRSLAGAQWFSAALASHQLGKHYLGIAQGKFDHQQVWEGLLEGRSAKTIASPHAQGEYQGAAVTLVEYVIETGRKRQIRVHTGQHGFPLLGDTRYGGLPQAALPLEPGFYLHAWKLYFPRERPPEFPERIVALLPVFFEKMLATCLIHFDLALYNE
jgi:23S rRNA pseudouridine955/2504/2580 synthase